MGRKINVIPWNYASAFFYQHIIISERRINYIKAIVWMKKKGILHFCSTWTNWWRCLLLSKLCQSHDARNFFFTTFWTLCGVSREKICEPIDYYMKIERQKKFFRRKLPASNWFYSTNWIWCVCFMVLCNFKY